MILNSPKSIVERPQQDVFDFLSQVENFEKLMPESIQKFEVLGPDTFLFALKGMPEITLEKKQLEAPGKILLDAAGGKIDFSLIGLIEALDDNRSEVQLTFQGDFNPMMAMMIKGPISKFIETLVNNISKSI